MKIGVPKEIKSGEFRVGLVPDSVQVLVAQGHRVVVEKSAGEGAGFDDAMYQAVGAVIEGSAEKIFKNCELIIKVKEPQQVECARLRPGQALFSYLHLAPDKEQARALLASKCTAIAYETITDGHGGLPILAPMSEVAGAFSVQVAAHCLEKNQGGSGVLLAPPSGVLPGTMLVVGGGHVGVGAIRVALGMGINIGVFDKSAKRLAALKSEFGDQLMLFDANEDDLAKQVANADVVIGAVLVPGAASQKIITREVIKKMRPGSVVLDVAIDQGGCIETSRPTTHDNPTFIEEGVVHYCVTNMPAAVPRTASFALNNVSLPYILKLANEGLKVALMSDEHFRNGLNIHNGQVTHKAVANALGYRYVDAKEALEHA